MTSFAGYGSAQGMPKSHAEVAPWRGRFFEGYVPPEAAKRATGKRIIFAGNETWPDAGYHGFGTGTRHYHQTATRPDAMEGSPAEFD